MNAPVFFGNPPCLLSRAQAELGLCIGMMRHAAALMEKDFPDSARRMREEAKRAEAVRWEREEPVRRLIGDDQ